MTDLQPRIEEKNDEAGFASQVIEDLDSKTLSDKSRIGFIRKVYGILSVELITTAVFVMVSLYSKAYRTLIDENISLL